MPQVLHFLGETILFFFKISGDFKREGEVFKELMTGMLFRIWFRGGDFKVLAGGMFFRIWL
ncbi:MAG TPA: hypothetical protein VKM55_02950 [Candidatus Lokiarchaeia archaeon]|nr:hypothetical protein [Candidatus Lokiarchaeia archaeon]